MGRSLWFRVYAIRLFALFRLAFASAPHFLLNLAGSRNSLAHSSIGTPSTAYGSSTVCKHTVSGSISLPSRGAFHLSLMVLCAIGRYLCFALEGGPPCFHRGFSCPDVLRILLLLSPFRLPGFHRLRLRFPPDSTRVSVFTAVLYPEEVSFFGLGFSPVRSPLLGVSRLISFPPAT